MAKTQKKVTLLAALTVLLVALALADRCTNGTDVTPGPLHVEVWGALREIDIVPYRDATWWWADQKAKVVHRYAGPREGAGLVVFFDDTLPNVQAVDAASRTAGRTGATGAAEVLAFHVNPQRPRSLSSTGEDMFVRLARAAEEAGLAPDRVVAVFDFDLTISDHHSGGTDVALAEDGRVDCGIGRPCFTDQAAVRADLSSVARRFSSS